MSQVHKKPAVFLDRDGTINVEKDYLYKTEDFEFIPEAQEAIKALKAAGYLLVVVTNQSGVARGYYSLDDVARLHEYIQRELHRYQTGIDAFYVCPHHPTSGKGAFRKSCTCRKGGAGMLLQAAVDHDIDLRRSFMVGDKQSDIEAAENAGCKPVLVLTGYGNQAVQELQVDRAKICQDISAAASWIIESGSLNG